MDKDSSPKAHGRSVEPINDLNTPKLPHFDSLTEEHETASVGSDTPTVTPNQAQDATDNKTKGTPTIGAPKKDRRGLTKRQRIIFGLVALVLIVGGGVIAYLNQPKDVGSVSVSKKLPSKVKVVTYGNLSGVAVDSIVNQRPVTGVMIENSEDARPQSGMDQASIVFEAIAEGGITRFLTLYQENQPDYIGPVRSLRPYYLNWCMSFDCAIAHVGGSPEALQDVKDWGGKDLDQFANGGSYWRIDSRYAPHNVYTSTANLNALEAGKGFGAAQVTPFTRKKDAVVAMPNASSIDVNISSADFNSHYDWDAATNSYKRSQAGAPHTVVHADGSEVQLQPKVVVALMMSYGLEADDHHSQYGAIGSGVAYIFQDGTVTQGTWTKTDAKTALTLTDAAGKPLALNAGQRWFVALPDTSHLTYQ